MKDRAKLFLQLSEVLRVQHEIQEQTTSNINQHKNKARCHKIIISILNN